VLESTPPVVSIVGAIFGLLLLAAATHPLARRVGIRFPIALVLVGILVGELADAGLGFLEPIRQLEIPAAVIVFVFLPTLVFGEAMEMDGRDLQENLGPVLALAIPGLIVSTLLTGVLLRYGAPVVGFALSWPEALLLGSILSATDPVGVTDMFKQIGAPKRLMVLVEGESLFNDATSIALSRALLGFVLAGGAVGVSAASIGLAIWDFAFVFLGGIAVGWGAAVIVGILLGWIEDNAFIEISLTTVLAYLSFIIAEESLGVSGVMATLAAGLLIGGWGRTKISPAVNEQVENQWAYLGDVAHALLFLMVGLRVDVSALAAVLPLLGLAVLTMLFARTVSVAGLMPLVGRLPGAEPVGRSYQAVIIWGGLRGGIALAIALALPPIPGRDTIFIPVAMGAVLFTLLVQGLSIERLVRRLGLDVPPLSDRVARLEGLISAKQRTLDQIPELQSGGLFSPRIADTVSQRCEAELERMKAELEVMRAGELDLAEERPLLYLRCFGEEKTLYYVMFSRGHLSERTYRDLAHSIELQTEAIRHEGRLPEFTLHPPTGERIETVIFRKLDRIAPLGGMVERLRASRIARDYEVTWARSRGSERVLETLDERALNDPSRAGMTEEVRAFYQFWHENARARLDQTAELFPEFVAATQERLADRLVLHAEQEAIEEKAHAGIIPEGVAEAMLTEMAEDLRQLRASQVSHLRIEPEELLRKVPFFQTLPAVEFASVAARLRRRTAPAGEVIVRQGDTGDSLYLVARGVIRVSRQDGGSTRDLATLMAGDFFGETTLLHGGTRTASCRAATPCALYELKREEFDMVVAVSPTMRQALEEADRRRRAERLEGATVPG
jgi:CPA1 family monovalent cation:H+ antiporter